MPSYRVLPLPLPPLTQHHSISIHLPFLNSIRQRLLIDASRTESELELFNILSNLIEIEIHYNSTACRSSIVLIKKVDISIEIPRFFCSFFFFSKSCAKMNENSKRYLSHLVKWWLHKNLESLRNENVPTSQRSLVQKHRPPEIKFLKSSCVKNASVFLVRFKSY